MSTLVRIATSMTFRAQPVNKGRIIGRIDTKQAKKGDDSCWTGGLDRNISLER